MPPTPRIARRRRMLALLTLGILGGGIGLAAWSALRPDPLRPALRAFDRGDLPAAVRASLDALRDRPGDPGASLIAARSLHRLGLDDRAEIHYARAGVLGPDDRHDRAYGLIRLGQSDAAAPILETILAERPDDPLALQRLAAIRIGQERLPDALALAERLSTVAGQEVRGFTLVGSIHHQAHHYTEAVAAYRRVLELDPELAAMPLPRRQFWSELALDLMAFGQTEEARGYLRRGLEAGPDAALMELLGLAHQQDGAVDEAERCWKQAVEWDPALPDAWLNLGRLALQRQRPGEAIPLLRKAAELSPEAIEPLYSLAQAHRLRGETAEADRLSRRVEQMRAADPSRR